MYSSQMRIEIQINNASFKYVGHGLPYSFIPMSDMVRALMTANGFNTVICCLHAILWTITIYFQDCLDCVRVRVCAIGLAWPTYLTFAPVGGGICYPLSGFFRVKKQIWHSFLPINFAHCVKISAQGHQIRSPVILGDEVTFAIWVILPHDTCF